MKKLRLVLIGLLFVFAGLTNAGAEPSALVTDEMPATIVSLTDQDKAALMSFARKAISEYLDKGSRLQVSPAEQTAALREQKGCFVTLTKHGALRGCIGYLVPEQSLCDCVVSNAVSAAVHDQRFTPVATQQELDTLDIEISVLSVPQRLSVTSADGVLQVLVPGTDGVILKQGWRQATYLPQVWEHFTAKTDFLNSLCRKGGMSSDCWQDPDTEVYLYRVEVINEKKN